MRGLVRWICVAAVPLMLSCDAGSAPSGGTVADTAAPDTVVDAGALQLDGAADTAPLGPDVVPDGGVALPDAGTDTGEVDSGAAPAPDVEPQPDVAPGDVVDAQDVPWGAPPSVTLTVDELPADMNGSQPYTDGAGELQTFRILLPTHGFSIDVGVEEGGSDIDLTTLSVTASVPVGSYAAGANLAGLFAEDEAGARLLVPEGAPFPVGGGVTLTATVADIHGQTSAPASILVDIGELTPTLDPFEAVDTWLLVLSRDIFSIELEIEDGSAKLGATYLPAGNGVEDFDEALHIVGLLGGNPTWNAWARETLVARLRALLYQVYELEPDGSIGEGSVRIQIVFEGDEGAPDPSEYPGTPGAPLSLMALGGDGDPSDIANNIVGRADLDWGNQVANDNSGYGRGVFVTSIVRQLLTNQTGLWLLTPIVPGAGGVALGDGEGDELLMDPDFDAEAHPELSLRHDLLEVALLGLSKAIAATCAHEMGHSLGLVPKGAPPKGLFASEPNVSFIVKPETTYHIDTAGLNVMQTGKNTDYIEAATGTIRFNPLNLAYLRRRLIVTY